MLQADIVQPPLLLLLTCRTVVHPAQTINLTATDSRYPYLTVQSLWNVSAYKYSWIGSSLAEIRLELVC